MPVAPASIHIGSIQISHLATFEYIGISFKNVVLNAKENTSRRCPHRVRAPTRKYVRLYIYITVL